MKKKMSIWVEQGKLSEGLFVPTLSKVMHLNPSPHSMVFR